MTPDEIAEALSRVLEPERLHLRAPLAPYTTFRIGGPADVLFEATSADELAAAVTLARTLDIPWFVLGLGANILVSDHGVRGLVIRNRATAHTLGDDGILWTESGAGQSAKGCERAFEDQPANQTVTHQFTEIFENQLPPGLMAMVIGQPVDLDGGFGIGMQAFQDLNCF